MIEVLLYFFNNSSHYIREIERVVFEEKKRINLVLEKLDQRH